MSAFVPGIYNTESICPDQGNSPMPHLILEYAQDLASTEEISRLVVAVHEAAVTSGLFEKSHIKTRAIPVSIYRTGEGRSTFIHVQVRLHSGRTQAQKQALSTAVLDAIRHQGLPVGECTVEIVDMDRATYSKYSNLPR